MMGSVARLNLESTVPFNISTALLDTVSSVTKMGKGIKKINGSRPKASRLAVDIQVFIRSARHQQQEFYLVAKPDRYPPSELN
jgi:hypothetical protein